MSGIGSRFLAIAFDTLLQALAAVILVVIGFLVGTAVVESTKPIESAFEAQSGWTIAAIIFGVFLIVWGYFMFFETIWNGQTPGKKLVGIRVVREGGQPVDFVCAAARNLMRYLDFMPGMYTVGLISIFVSPRYKRLGDYAAGTIVVKERRPQLVEIRRPAATEEKPVRASLFELHSISGLSPEDLAAVRRFVERRADLPLNVQEEVAEKIAAPIMARLAIVPPADAAFSYGDFLQAIYALDREQQSFR